MIADAVPEAAPKYEETPDGLPVPIQLPGLIGFMSALCSIVVGHAWLSTLVASLTSFLMYSGLSFAGCWLLYPIDPARTRRYAEVAS